MSSSRFSSLLGALTLGVVSLLSTLSSPVQAAQYVVTNFNDTDDTCTAQNCSLREAIKAANASPDDDEVVISPSILNPYAQIGLVGPPIAIAAAGKLSVVADSRVLVYVQGGKRLFSVASGSDIAFTNFGFQGGYTYNEDRGGAFIIDNSQASFTKCEFKDNRAYGGGAGVATMGGKLFLNECTFFNNDSDMTGGALDADGTAVEVVASTFAGNEAFEAGGAIRVNGGALSLSNSTISGNRIVGYVTAGGGALQVQNAPVSLESCTITGNRADYINPGTRGGIVLSSGSLSLSNSIVAGNSPEHGFQDIVKEGGQVVNNGFNLIGSNASVEAEFPAGSFTGTSSSPLDPKLAPLRSNYRDIYTHAPLPGSPALDQGNSPLLTDERGSFRPSDLASIPNAPEGNGSDIGAFESVRAPFTGSWFVVNSVVDYEDGTCSVDSCSLRDAINLANDLSARGEEGPFQITFDTEGQFSRPQQISLDGRSLELKGPVSITGTPAGLTIKGYDVAAFSVLSGVAEFTDLTFGGQRTNAAAIYVAAEGRADLNRCSVVGNSGYYGAAVDNWGELNAINCTFANNRFALSNRKQMRLTHCTVANNFSQGNGAGIWNARDSTLTLESSIVANNTAPNAPDIWGTFGGDNNLIGNAQGSTATGQGNLYGQDPKLGQLANYGGSTPTIPLLPGSLAINRGLTLSAEDQRRVPRPQGGASDIGAFEVSDSPADSAVVTTAADEDNGSSDPNLGQGTSLREAINFANSNFGQTDITFALPSEARTLLLDSALPALHSDLSITGPVTNPGVKISRNPNVREGFGLLDCTGGRIRIDNLILSGGPRSGEDQAYPGPAIRNNGSDLTVTACTITNNYDLSAAGLVTVGSFGVYVPSTTVRNCTIANNYGAGLWASDANLTVDSCTIVNNDPAQSSVGGLVAQSSAAVTIKIGNSIIVGNGASSGSGNDLQAGLGTGSTYSASAPNLLGKGDLPTGAVPSQSNLALSALKLGPLGENGGPTPTIPIREGSRALDAGSTSLKVDQRGKKRPYGAAADIGAYEAQANTPPVIKSVTLTPERLTTDATITAVVVATDAETKAKDLTLSYEWTRIRGGKKVVLPETGPSISAKGTVLELGDELLLKVIAYDNFTQSTPFGVATSIANSPIQITGFDLKPRNPYSFETMVATARTTDPDRTKPTYTFTWKKNDVVTRTFTGKASQDLYNLRTEGLGDKGDVIEVSVVAIDGESSASAQGSASIRNSIPVVESLSLSPQAPTSTSTVVSAYSGRDADGDKLTRTYKWRIGTKLLKDESGSRLDLRKYPFVKVSDVVSLDLQLFDGQAYSKTLTAKVTVAAPANTAPASLPVVKPSASSF